MVSSMLVHNFVLNKLGLFRPIRHWFYLTQFSTDDPLVMKSNKFIILQGYIEEGTT